MDDIDKANDHIERELEERIRAARGITGSGYGPAHCVRCTANMPPERRSHGLRLCYNCQTKDELTAKLYGK